VLYPTNKYLLTSLAIFALGLIFVFFTNPFLRYPYDVFAHLISIDELYHGASDTTTSIQQGRLLWHDIWATIFHFLNIDSQQLFLRAKIIYIMQTSLTLFSIYYFSNVILRNVFKTIDKTTLLYLSMWSTIIWLTIFATHSLYHHLVWNLWYSINYQITLPLFWYITALTLVLVLEQTSTKTKLFSILQILLISSFIIRVHSMELMYYFMYVSLLSLVYLDKLYYLIKKYYYVIIPLMSLIIYTIAHYQVESPQIFNYLTLEKFPLLYDKIMTIGSTLLNALNRANSGSINELMLFIFYFSFLFLMLVLWRRNKDNNIFNYRILLFCLLSALFAFIPLTQFTAGLFALIARPDVIHRIYYSSSLFLLLPIIAYYLFILYRIPLKFLNLVMALLLISVYLFSKYSPESSHYYYKNIQSIQNTFSPNQYDFHLSQKNIDLIGQKVKNYEKNNQTEKETYFYARADIAFVIKYMYHKKVFWKGRRTNPNFIKAYKNRNNDLYQNILLETPQDFPKYIPYW